jgi:hypothetical protein
MNELDREFREAIETLYRGLGFFKAEIVTNPDGPDRIRITRRV